MRNLFLAGVFIFFGAFQVCAQDEPNPVTFSLKLEKTYETLRKGETFDANLNVAIEKGWHLYALEKIDGGPLPTKISIADDASFTLEKISAPPPIEIDDSTFGVTTKFYENPVKFTLVIKATNDSEKEKSKLKIRIRFQTCNDQICLPPKTAIVDSDSQAVSEDN